MNGGWINSDSFDMIMGTESLQLSVSSFVVINQEQMEPFFPKHDFCGVCIAYLFVA